MRLPAGYGCIRLISGGRTNPYAVHPPTVNGRRPKAICYVPDRATGLAVLSLYHAGEYRPGMEVKIMPPAERSDGLCVECIYGKYLAWRMSPACRKKPDKNVLNSAFAKLAPYHHLTLDQVGVDDWQALVNDVAERYSKTTVQRVIGLIKNLYKYALARELCTKNYGAYIEAPPVRTEEHHQDFTDRELDILWENRHDPVVKMVLVMCYSGFRLGAFPAIETHLDEEIPYFKGGVKTQAGRNRIVPIHNAILEMIRLKKYSCGKAHIGKQSTP